MSDLEQNHHILVGARPEPARRAGPRRRPVRPARLQHLLARGRARRARRASAGSPSASTSSRHPLEQVVKQLFKLIDVVKISELDPRRSVERELLLATVRSSAEQRGQVVELVNIFEGKILAVGIDAITVASRDTPTSSTTSKICCAGYGIVELQRTGRVALPKLDRPTHACARLRAESTNKGKAG